MTCTVSDTRHEYDAGEKQAQVTVDTAVPGLTIRESDYTVAMSRTERLPPR